MSLNQFEILFYAMAGGFSFTKLLWVNAVKSWQRKPFNCMKCMSGWFALSLALISGYGWQSGLLFIAGVFIGAIAEGIIMRYL